MSLRYLLDEDISPRAAEGLRRETIDAISVHEVDRGNRRVPDEAQLAYATADQRVLVTYNRADYQALDGQWRLGARAHAGILWCAEKSIPCQDIGSLIRALAALAHEYETLMGVCLPLSHQQRP
jgi:predicted nuclease of predicted toxin-antitoxin system